MVDKKLDQGSWNVYQRKRWWMKKFEGTTEEPFPNICPMTINDDRYPPEYNTIEDAKNEINTAKKCKLYNSELDCECWFRSNPGRCDCWLVYWDCSMFRQWLKIKEINVVVE